MLYGKLSPRLFWTPSPLNVIFNYCPFSPYLCIESPIVWWECMLQQQTQYWITIYNNCILISCKHKYTRLFKNVNIFTYKPNICRERGSELDVYTCNLIINVFGFLLAWQLVSSTLRSWGFICLQITLFEQIYNYMFNKHTYQYIKYNLNHRIDMNVWIPVLLCDRSWKIKVMIIKLCNIFCEFWTYVMSQTCTLVVSKFKRALLCRVTKMLCWLIILSKLSYIG